MEILRVPPYPIVTTWDVPDASHDYLIYIEDVVDHSIETESVTSNSSSQITYTLPRAKVQYDRDFVFRIYDTNIYGEIVTDSNLTVYRPYVDPNMLGTTATEIAEYKRWEIISRSIIDAYLGNDSATGEGFYNHKLIVQGIGDGTDYYPIWHNPKRVLKVYENNQLVFNGEDATLLVESVASDTDYTSFTTNTENNYAIGDFITISGFVPTDYNGVHQVLQIDSTTEFSVKKITTSTPTTLGTALRDWEQKYVISPNNSAIMRFHTGIYNRAEQKPPTLPRGYGDIGPYGLSDGVAFPRGYDYTFVLDVGYKAVPPDVEIAATMLIEDLKCNRNEYYSRFITQYSTDQFNIKFAPEFLKGTGNLIVDKILDGYKGNVFKPAII